MNNQNPSLPKSDVEIRQILEKKQPLTDKVFDAIAEPILGIDRLKTKKDKLANLADDQKKLLLEVQENAVAGFLGNLNELESALGMLLMGHHFGWKVLYLIHSKKTIRNYEDILGIKIRDIFPEEGPSAYRSNGLALAKKASNFWKVVSGEEKIDDRRTVK